MALTVRDINPDLKIQMRCKSCGKIQDILDLEVCGDCMVCPLCGEWESFEEVKQ